MQKIWEKDILSGEKTMSRDCKVGNGRRCLRQNKWLSLAEYQIREKKQGHKSNKVIQRLKNGYPRANYQPGKSIWWYLLLKLKSSISDGR